MGEPTVVRETYDMCPIAKCKERVVIVLHDGQYIRCCPQWAFWVPPECSFNELLPADQVMELVGALRLFYA